MGTNVSDIWIQSFSIQKYIFDHVICGMAAVILLLNILIDSFWWKSWNDLSKLILNSLRPKKWPSFCKRHSQTHFLQWKCFNFICNEIPFPGAEQSTSYKVNQGWPSLLALLCVTPSRSVKGRCSGAETRYTIVFLFNFTASRILEAVIQLWQWHV